MARRRPKAIMQVQQSFTGVLADGTPVTYFEGELVYGDEPAVERWPKFFAPPVIRARPGGLIPTVIQPETPK